MAPPPAIHPLELHPLLCCACTWYRGAVWLTARNTSASGSLSHIPPSHACPNGMALHACGLQLWTRQTRHAAAVMIGRLLLRHVLRQLEESGMTFISHVLQGHPRATANHQHPLVQDVPASSAGTCLAESNLVLVAFADQVRSKHSVGLGDCPHLELAANR